MDVASRDELTCCTIYERCPTHSQTSNNYRLNQKQNKCLSKIELFPGIVECMEPVSCGYWGTAHLQALQHWGPATGDCCISIVFTCKILVVGVSETVGGLSTGADRSAGWMRPRLAWACLPGQMGWYLSNEVGRYLAGR